MSEYKRISIEAAQTLLAAGEALLLDVRDEQSFVAGHVPGALHLGNHNLEDFLASADRGAVVIVYCYHGNSSQGAAAFLNENGFAETYSVDGGFEAWRAYLD